MKRGRRAIIIGLAVAIPLAAVLFILLRDDGGNTEKGLITIHEMSTNDVRQINIGNNGDEVTLIKKDGVWYSDDGAKEADRLAVDSALTQLCYLYAADIVSENGSERLGSFGLDPPRLSVELVMADGTGARILFGVFTSDQKHCYFMKQGDVKVYLLPTVNYNQIESGLTFFADLSLKIRPAALSEITFSRENGTTVKLMRIGADARLGNEQWILLEPFKANANVRLAALVEALLTPPRLASYVGAEEKPEYGIGSGGIFNVVDAEGGSVDFLIGARAEDGNYYCTVSGKQGVYSVYAAYEELFGIDLGNCIQNAILPLDPNTVHSFALVLEGKELRYDAAAGTLNGALLSDDQTKTLFESISAVTFDGTIGDEPPQGDELGYFLIDEEKAVSFCAYKDDYYAVSSFGGDAAVYIRKAKLDELIQIN